MSYQQPLSQPGQPGYGGYGAYGGNPGGGAAQLDIHTKYHPMAFVLALTGPGMAIDGHELRLKWGQQQVPVPAGQHQIEIWTRYLTKMGSAVTTIQVAPGQTVPLFYAAPTVVFLRGALGHHPVKVPGGVFTTIMMIFAILMIVLACLVPVLAALLGN